MGVPLQIGGTLGEEVRRWGVPFTRKRIRLFDRGDRWAVLAHGAGISEMYAYPTRETAETVCAAIMAADSDQWREVQLPALWWS